MLIEEIHYSYGRGERNVFATRSQARIAATNLFNHDPDLYGDIDQQPSGYVVIVHRYSNPDKVIGFLIA